MSGYISGGLEARFVIERADGKPIAPDRRYCMVLDFSGADPHALKAALTYAESVEAGNPKLSADIRATVKDPSIGAPQHRYATSTP